MTLASSLATNTLSLLRTLKEQNELNLRSFITAMGNEGKIINELLETSVGLTPEEKIEYMKMDEGQARDPDPNLKPRAQRNNTPKYPLKRTDSTGLKLADHEKIRKYLGRP